MTKHILIYTMSCGDGHNMVSFMLRDTFKKFHGDECEVKVIDYYKDYPSPIRSFLSEKVFRYVMVNVHWFYRIYYSMYLKDAPPKRYPIGMWYAHLGKFRRVLKTVDEFKPDIIIGTHMFQPIGLTRLKDKGKLNVPFYSIVTDYTVYPLTEYGQGVEKIIIPSEDLRAGHMRLGYRNDQIVALGFPVRLERPAERPNRGRGKLHVTIMSGPGRMKRIDREIKELLAADLDIHVSIMNGKDERHRRKIEGMISKARPKRTVVNNCGFVDDATYERILNDSDILVTKCGGNTLSEAIKLGKVVITSSEQVGQELDNLNFFKERIPIFQTEKGKGIADILRENNFDDAFLDRYWSMTEGIVPAEGYKAYVDLFWGEMQP